MQDGGWRRYLEERTVANDAETVFARVRPRAEQCLNLVKRSTTPGPYGGQSDRVDYLTTTSAPEPGTGEITVQMGSPNLLNGPDGGVYILVADVAPAGARATKVTVYAVGKGGDLMAPFFDWAEGRAHACPEL